MQPNRPLISQLMQLAVRHNMPAAQALHQRVAGRLAEDPVQDLGGTQMVLNHALLQEAAALFPARAEDEQPGQ